MRFIQLCGIFLFATVVGANDIENQNLYKEFELQPGKLYEIKVKSDNGATTIAFPSKIKRLAARNVALDASKDYMLRMAPGGAMFDVACMKPGKIATVNIFYNNQLYVLLLKHDPNEAYAAVSFRGTHSRPLGYVNRQPKVSDARLLSMLDVSKCWDVLVTTQPKAIGDGVRVPQATTYDFKEFQIRLIDVCRFDKDDTLVFKCQMMNPNPYEINYDKNSFTVQVGQELYNISAVDASGVMPPQSTSWAFFSITGSPRGARNNIAATNQFLVAVTTRKMLKDATSSPSQSVEVK